MTRRLSVPAAAGCPRSEPCAPGCAEQPRLHGDGLSCRSKTSSVVSWSAFCSLAFARSGSCLLSASSDGRRGTGQDLVAVAGDGGCRGHGAGWPLGRRAQPAARCEE